MTANRAASIRTRLKQHADASKQDFNLTLTRYGLERPLPKQDLGGVKRTVILVPRCQSPSSNFRTATAMTVLSEIGPDMSRFPTVKHFTSWLPPKSKRQRPPEQGDSTCDLFE